MTDIRLLTWASPAFPIGAFAHSGGLEAAVAHAIVRDAASLADWLAAQMEGGTIRTDALAVARAVPASEPELAELDALVLALAGSPTRHAELTALGRAFVEATRAWWPGAWLRDGEEGRPRAYPVAFGALAGAHGLGGADAALAFVQAAAMNAVGAAQRLLPIGQSAAMRVMRDIEPAIETLARDATTTGPDEWGTGTLATEIAALAHPTLEPRLFRS